LIGNNKLVLLAVRYRPSFMCQLSFGWLVKQSRKSRDWSQQKSKQIIEQKFAVKFDWKELAKLENERVDLTDFSVFIDCFCTLFEFDRYWVQEICDQTEIKTIDFSLAIFPIYFEATDK